MTKAVSVVLSESSEVFSARFGLTSPLSNILNIRSMSNVKFVKPASALCSGTTAISDFLTSSGILRSFLFPFFSVFENISFAWTLPFSQSHLSVDFSLSLVLLAFAEFKSRMLSSFSLLSPASWCVPEVFPSLLPASKYGFIKLHGQLIVFPGCSRAFLGTSLNHFPTSSNFFLKDTSPSVHGQWPCPCWCSMALLWTSDNHFWIPSNCFLKDPSPSLLFPFSLVFFGRDASFFTLSDRIFHSPLENLLFAPSPFALRFSLSYSTCSAITESYSFFRFLFFSSFPTLILSFSLARFPVRFLPSSLTFQIFSLLSKFFLLRGSSLLRKFSSSLASISTSLSTLPSFSTVFLKSCPLVLSSTDSFLSSSLSFSFLLSTVRRVFSSFFLRFSLSNLACSLTTESYSFLCCLSAFSRFFLAFSFCFSFSCLFMLRSSFNHFLYSSFAAFFKDFSSSFCCRSFFFSWTILFLRRSTSFFFSALKVFSLSFNFFLSLVNSSFTFSLSSTFFLFNFCFSLFSATKKLFISVLFLRWRSFSEEILFFSRVSAFQERRRFFFSFSKRRLSRRISDTKRSASSARSLAFFSFFFNSRRRILCLRISCPRSCVKFFSCCFSLLRKCPSDWTEVRFPCPLFFKYPLRLWRFLLTIEASSLFFITDASYDFTRWKPATFPSDFLDILVSSLVGMLGASLA